MPEKNPSLGELENVIAALGLEIAKREGEATALPRSGNRTIRVARGTLINFAGLVFAVPTGGISTLLCAAGLWEWAECLVDDAAITNREIELRRELRDLHVALDAAETELENRKRPK